MANVLGTSLNDTISPFSVSPGVVGVPTSGADTVNGGLGADTMDAGDGNDTYIVDNIGDIVKEQFDDTFGGVDTVLSSVSYSLSPGTTGNQGFGIENLTLTGTANINATGNAKNNLLLGNGAANTFFSSAGNDTINGGLGTDTANYSALTNVVTLGAFGVVKKGTLGTDSLIAVESIVGSSLLGDTVDHSGASVAPATGTITNLTTGAVTVNGTTSPLPLSFTVSQFENVIGSGFNDSITGDAGNNLLAGGSGNDTLNGGAGNDRIFGDVSLAFSSPVFSFNNKFYTLTTAASWTQAQAQAVALGGNLVTVNDAAENQFLVNTFGGTERLWLGLTDEVTEGTFRWANGEAVTYTNWSVGQPDNFNNEDYAEFNLGGAGKWNDLPNAALSLRGIVEIGNSNDLIFGGAGNDTINGGVGLDVVDYSALGATVSLGAFGVVNKGTLGTDSLIAVESIIGSSLLGDTVDHSGASVAPATGTITNLTTGAVTVNGTASPLPLTFTVSQFENVTGSGFADTITGNSANNSLSGGAGNDTFFGTAGTDTINGGLGTDTANYSALTNVVTLGAFGVVKKGTLGTDSLIAVESIIGSSLLGDTVDHSGATVAPATGTITNLTTGAVTVNGTASPLPLTFTVSQFENVIGSGFADTITGNDANNSLSGGTGNDTISGLSGNDTLLGGGGDDFLDGGLGVDLINGGTGSDTTTYAFSSGPINANLSTGVVSSGTEVNRNETLISIENLIGSSGDDTLTGSVAFNSLEGALGNDLFFGSAGNDTLSGGQGSDTANYSAFASVVSLGGFGILNKGALGTDTLIAVETIVGSGQQGDTVDHSLASFAPSTGTITNLTTGAVTVNGTAPLPLSFTVSQFENVIGSGLADSITGNSANNVLSGASGNDSIFGSAGVDTINGGLGTDTANYSSLGGVVTLGAFGTLNKGSLGTDTLIDVEVIVGSSLSGDTVDHSGASVAPATGTYTDLSSGTVFVNGTADPLPLAFSVSQFENVIGSGFADTIIGNADSNSLSGGGGNDSLDGGVGNDTLIGGAGDDTLIGGIGFDVLTGGAGNDRFRFLSLTDRIDVIKDFSSSLGNLGTLNGRDFIEVSATGFGATSLSQFNYNVLTGALAFLGTEFATIENRPTGFVVTSDVVLI